MAQFNNQMDDEPTIDGSSPISGVDNSQPPAAIGPTLAADAENRLSALDGVNRPRPGITRLQKPSASFDSIHHIGDGKFLLNNAGSWFRYDSRRNVMNPTPLGPGFVTAEMFILRFRTMSFISQGGGQRTWRPDVEIRRRRRFQPGSFADPYSLAMYPLWAIFRLIYANDNTLIISDILDPEIWDLTNQTLTLDPIKSRLHYRDVSLARAADRRFP